MYLIGEHLQCASCQGRLGGGAWTPSLEEQFPTGRPSNRNSTNSAPSNGVKPSEDISTENSRGEAQPREVVVEDREANLFQGDSEASNKMTLLLPEGDLLEVGDAGGF